MSAAPNPTGEVQADGTLLIHATTVAVDRRALVILGPSGSGKSALALQLMALGADLIADDRTILTPTHGGPPVASCPPALLGKIEARGVGILCTQPAGAAPAVGFVDLAQSETDRFPPERTHDVLGWRMPCFHKVATDYFASALLIYLKGGRSAA